MSLTTTELNDLRDYYEQDGRAIATQIFEDDFGQGEMTSLEFKDTYRHDIADTTEAMQSYQKKWTPKGGVAIRPRIQRHSLVKADMEFEPRKHNARAYESYLARTGNDPYDMPYYAFIIQQVLAQWAEDLAFAIWQGRDLGPIDDAPNAARDAIDGLLYKIMQSAFAGELEVYLTGPIIAATAFDQIETFVKDCLDTAKKRQRRHVLFCSQTTADDYQTSYQEQLGTTIHADEFGNLRLRGTNTTLMPITSLTGSELVLVRPENTFFGYDGDISFIPERQFRSIYFLVDGKFSVDYARADEVWVNDQAISA